MFFAACLSFLRGAGRSIRTCVYFERGMSAVGGQDTRAAESQENVARIRFLGSS